MAIARPPLIDGLGTAPTASYPLHRPDARCLCVRRPVLQQAEDLLGGQRGEDGADARSVGGSA